MKYLAPGLAFIAAASLAGCATNSSQRAGMQESDPSNGIICTHNVPTGSSIRERTCTTPEQREAQRRQAEHQIVLEPAKGNAR